MQLTIKFDVDNSAYRAEDDSLDPEKVATPLQFITGQIRAGAEYGHIRDDNGNTVGAWHIDVPV